MNKDQVFLHYIELHERAWGMDTYPGRPTLQAILDAHIVALWNYQQRRDPGFRITLHETPHEIHEHASQLVLESKTKPPERRLVRLYVNKQQVRIKGVKVLFELVTEPTR